MRTDYRLAVPINYLPHSTFNMHIAHIRNAVATLTGSTNILKRASSLMSAVQDADHFTVFQCGGFP